MAGDTTARTFLIDGPKDIDLSQFHADDTVLITAGASAPETVVEQCVEMLKERFGAVVDSRTIREEEVYFPLPKEVRQLAAVSKS